MKRSLTIQARLVGFLPLSFFLIHSFYYLRHGGLSHMLWMCNIGNLLLGLGLLFDQPTLIRVAVFWLIPGLPLWIWFMAIRGGWLLTSSLAHVGGLIVGLFALTKVRTGRHTWLYATAWFLMIQQVCRLMTPAELNVNVAHRIFSGWETVFSTYGQFWIATTLAVVCGSWLLGFILLKLLPPYAAGSAPESS